MKNLQNGAKMVQNQIIFHVLTYVSSNKDRFPKFVFAALLVLSMLTAFSLGFALSSPLFMEVVRNAALSSVYLFLSIAWPAFGLIIARQLVVSGRRVWREEFAPVEGQASEDQKQLQAWTPPSVLPDTLIALLPGEEVQDFIERANEAKERVTHSEWLAVVPFRSGQAGIYPGGAAEGNYIFDRENPPFNLREDERIPEGVQFTTETDAEYRIYLDWFAYHFRRWSAPEKLAMNEKRAGNTLLEIVGKTPISVLLLFLLFSISAFGQSKTQQVVSAFGGRCGVPGIGDVVTYEFRGKAFERTGDGRHNYAELLANVPGFNDNGGKLIAVWNGTARMASAPDVERVNQVPDGRFLVESTTGDPIRPRGVANSIPQDAETGGGFSMPDSSQIAETMDRGKHGFDYLKSEAWKNVKPIWAAVMYFFISLVPLFVCVGGLFNYFAGTASEEGFYGITAIGRFIRMVHEMASGVTLVIAWAITAILLIDEFMLFVYAGISLWWMLVVWIPSVWIAKQITNWIVPNPPGSRLRSIPGNGRYNPNQIGA